MKRTFILITGLLLSTFAYSQVTSYSIKGTVNNDHGKPLEMGNVIILSKADSSLIKGDFFMDGSFEIKDITSKGVLLKITSLGFDDIIKSIDNTEEKSTVSVPTITLKVNNTLEEIEISAKVQTFERRAGKTIVNVANTVMAESRDVEAILKKSPRVKVKNNEVSILGKGNAVVYVDGKRVSFDVANQIPVSQIKSMEIITSPSAKYDADGAAVVNIITNNYHLVGSLLNIRSETDYTFLHKHLYFTPEVVYHFKKEKYSLIFRYDNEVGNQTHENQKSSLISNLGYKNISNTEYIQDGKNLPGFTLGSEFYLKKDRELSVELFT
ncbi:MAG: hypothetical protein HRT72_09355, partial [Flavobacteriales bacterium]|nr:hypothetical protein [Flavobacteriales bacterium]